VDITALVHDNHVYALTKGQASPTTPEEGVFLSRSQADGAVTAPFNPLSVAMAAGATFVARGFTGDLEQLSDIIQRAITHRGFALVDILQPCVSFN
jgi:2-oxoglutarate ferredoxin oxidoreductase subunit beta